MSRENLQYLKGGQFEDHVKAMFPDADFEILQEPDPEGSAIPDFRIRDRKTREKFWVEAKWRQHLISEKYKIGEIEEVKKYKAMQEAAAPERVFMVLGLGGEPSKPDQIFCIPISEVQYPEIYQSKLIPKKHVHATFRYERGRLY